MSAHDLGGRAGEAAPLDRADHELADWEVLVDTLCAVLARKGLRSAHESRRAQEELAPATYATLSYFERWAAAAEALLVEKGVLTRAEIDERVAELAESWETR